MNLSILHINIEGHKHLTAVHSLIKERNPDVVCLAEARYDDAKSLASQLGYELAFSQLLVMEQGGEVISQGSAILSKYPLFDTQKTYYNEQQMSENSHVYTSEELAVENGKRLENRFSFSYNLLTSKLKLSEDKVITIATTHFPVTDHTGQGLETHNISSIQIIDDETRELACMDRFINIVRQISAPIIFTADLNNPRGEYLYDLLAHELVDQVPLTLTSSIDPNLHRQKGLELMIDTIMTTPDISVKSFEVIEGVSDHKAFLAFLNI